MLRVRGHRAEVAQGVRVRGESEGGARQGERGMGVKAR